MKRELEAGGVPDLLRELYVARRDGTIRFSRGDEELSLQVRHGDIVGAESGVAGGRLDAFLVQQGLLTADDVEKALGAVARDEKPLPEVLLELGLMDESSLEDAVARHVMETLANVFTWDQGELAFEEEEPSQRLTLRLSTGALILEAVRATENPEFVTAALGDLDRTLQPSSDPLLRFQQLDLTPRDGFVLSRVDGALSAREIEQLIPLPAEDVRKSLLCLLSTGLIEWVPDAHRPGPEKQKTGSAPAPVPPATDAMRDRGRTPGRARA